MGHFQSLIKLKTALLITLIVNVFLFLIKFIFGYIYQATALWIDGLNSLADTFISLIILLMVLLAAKKPDHDHHYGHEKYEGLAYFLLGIVFLLTSIYLVFMNIQFIFERTSLSSNTNMFITLIVACISLLTKLFLYIYLKIVLHKTNHLVIKADVKNHLYDLISITLVIVSIFFSNTRLNYIDYIVSILIAVLIFKLALQMILESVSFLTDQAPIASEVEAIHDVILSHPQVIQIDDLKVRKHMYKRYVDVEIGVIESLSLKVAHEIAENVHDLVENKFSDVIHCMVHVNPIKKEAL